MKKTVFAVAIVVTAALAGCHKKAAPTTPTGGDMGGSGSAMAPAADGSAMAPAAGSGM
jgi:hypothetical protein